MPESSTFYLCAIRGSLRQHRGKYDCHAVSKWGYDNYGQKAKISGTMCYDVYGQGYVVPGSRYIIHGSY